MIIKYSDGYKYQLKNTIIIQTRLRPPRPCLIQGYVFLDIDGMLYIYEAYAWDGCTMAPNTEKNRLGCLVHDALKQLMQEGKLDKSFDPQCSQVLHDVMVEQGCYKAEADLFRWATRVFGGKFMKPKEQYVLIRPDVL